MALYLPWSHEIVRHEAARIGGDRRGVLADAHAGRLAADDPRADHRIGAVEERELPVALPDEAFGAVVAARLERAPAGRDRDVGALARVERLLHEVGREAAGLEARLEEVRVPGEHLPQDRKDRLVRQ